MTLSCKVVHRAIEFQQPERLPLFFESLGLSDVHTVGWNQTRTCDKRPRETANEWGCLRRRSEMDNMGQVKGRPFVLSDHSDGQAIGVHLDKKQSCWMPFWKRIAGKR